MLHSDSVLLHSCTHLEISVGISLAVPKLSETGTWWLELRARTGQCKRKFQKLLQGSIIFVFFSQCTSKHSCL